MRDFDENELRALLLTYEVCEPRPWLIEQTKHRVREELALREAAVPAGQPRLILALVVAALLLALNFFYMLSVGSVLRMLIPPQFSVYLSHSLYAFTAAEVCMIGGMFMALFLRHFQSARARLDGRTV